MNKYEIGALVFLFAAIFLDWLANFFVILWQYGRMRVLVLGLLVLVTSLVAMVVMLPLSGLAGWASQSMITMHALAFPVILGVCMVVMVGIFFVLGWKRPAKEISVAAVGGTIAAITAGWLFMYPSGVSPEQQFVFDTQALDAVEDVAADSTGKAADAVEGETVDSGGEAADSTGEDADAAEDVAVDSTGKAVDAVEGEAALESTAEAFGKHAQSITVATWNTLDTVTKEDLGALISAGNPDVIVLTEASKAKVEAALEGNGEWNVFYSPRSTVKSSIAETAVLLKPSVGNYKQHFGEHDTTFGTVVLKPEDNADSGDTFGNRLPVFIGVHSAPPVPGLMDLWREDTQTVWLASKCDQPGTVDNVIVAGDFNATLRHGPLVYQAGCYDAMNMVGKGNLGTWPKWLPAAFGSPIDHIFAHGIIKVSAGDVLNIGDSDHKAVIVTLHYI